MSHNYTAMRVRLDKEKHPDRYCPVAGCLWRVFANGKPDTPCRKHPTEPRTHCIAYMVGSTGCRCAKCWHPPAVTA